MNYFLNSNRINLVLIFLLVLLGIGSFAYNQYLIDQMLQQERSSVELYAKAIEYTSNPTQEEINRDLLGAIEQLRTNAAVPDSVIEKIEQAESDRTAETFVTSQILFDEDRNNVPAIMVDERGDVVHWENIDGEPSQEMVTEFSEMHDPIEIQLGDDNYSQMQYVYYGESPTVRLLRYFPYIQLSLLAILLGVAYVSYRTVSKAEQSNLWVGMAKEAAHQLGTPLSSLYGWVELLREEKGEDEFVENICSELGNDISRLRGIADRFNKIGSEPELESREIGKILEPVINYMKHRLPQLRKHVHVEQSIETNAKVRVNAELFQWAIENLIKNAMDAINTAEGEASVAIRVHEIEDEVVIDIEDTGSGIDKKYISDIFKPGYSTKKRGWGLGLSLTRRIIEEYHDGRIFVLRSELNVGTTMRVVLDRDDADEEETV